MTRTMVRAVPISILAALIGACICVACTGIMLQGDDGTVVAARTEEWGAFDFNSQLIYVPAGSTVTCMSPCDPCPGMTYVTQYRVIGIVPERKEDFYVSVADGMNECGLTIGSFYLPGFAGFEPFDSSRRDRTMGAGDLPLFLLSQCATVDEVCRLLTQDPPRFFIAPVAIDEFGGPLPLHYRVIDATGEAIVVEYINGGEVHIHQPVLGVITNSPTYDWHLTNLRTYIELQTVNREGIEIDGHLYTPLGGGSGMLGLPGDNTPPSRFVQAVAYTWTARPTLGGLDTVNEAFRILDHFNFATYGSEGSKPVTQEVPLPSATQWTSAADTKRRIYYYHTAWNRRLRMIDMKRIDPRITVITFMPLDPVPRMQDIEEVHIPVPEG